MKEIYIVCTSLNLGGAEIQSVWLANQFIKTGYKVSFVVLKKGNFIGAYLDKNINLIEYKMYAQSDSKSFVGFRKVYNFLKGIYLFRKRIKKQNTHIFSFLYHSNIFSFLSTLMTKNKHNICIRSDRFNSRNSLKNQKIRNLLVFIATFFCNKVIFNSSNAQKILGKNLPKKDNHVLIFNAVADFKFNFDFILESKIIEFLDNSQNKFVSIGRLEPLKNYENILKGFKQLKDEGFEFKYTIFGTGFLEAKLNEIIIELELSNNVFIAGGVRGAKEYLNHFDYYILGSINEGFPNSLIEAMSEGLVPFTTDAGDSYKIISNNRGVRIRGKCSEDFYLSIKNFFENKNENYINEIINNIDMYFENELNEKNIFKSWEMLIS